MVLRWPFWSELCSLCVECKRVQENLRNLGMSELGGFETFNLLKPNNFESLKRLKLGRGPCIPVLKRPAYAIFRRGRQLLNKQLPHHSLRHITPCHHSLT